MKEKNTRLPSLKLNFSWTLLGNLVYAFTQWAIITLIARIGNVEMVGQYTLALAITAPIYLFFQMNLRSIQATDRLGSFKLDDYMGFRLVTLLFTTSIIIVVLLFGDFTREMIWLISIIALAKSSELLSEVYYGVFQKNEVMKYIALSKMIRGITSATILGIVLYITNNILYATFSFSLSWIITLYLIDINLTKKIIRSSSFKSIIKPTINGQVFKGIFVMALPLGIGAALDSLNTNIPRYLISYYLDETSLGFFAAIAYIIVAGQTIIGALCHAATPRLAKYYFENNIKKFVTLLLKLSGIGLLVGGFMILISILLGDELLSFLYTEEFAAYNDILIIIVVAGLIWYMAGFINTAIIASRKFKLQIPILLVSTLVTLFTSWTLIPEYGLVGAGYSLIAGFLTRLLLGLYFLLKIIKN